MELVQIRQLVAVAEAKVLSRAAKQLHISQPALSRSIQNLEEELGVKLFDRKKNSMALNEAGALAVDCARAILRDVDALVCRLGEFSRQLLRIATCAPAPMWKLTAALPEQFPRLNVTAEMPDEDDIERLLRDGRADLAIMRREPADADIEAVPFMKEQLFVQIPLQNPLSQRDALHFCDLEGQTIRVYTGTGFWDKVHRLRIPRPTFIEYADFMIYMNVVKSTDSIVFVTALGHTMQSERPGCRTIPLQDGDATAMYRLAYLRRNRERLGGVVDWAVQAAQNW